VSTTDLTSRPDYPRMLRLDGRAFVVVGGGYGMGRQTADALAGVGVQVTCLDLDADRAAAVVAEIDGLALAGDASDAETLGLSLERARWGTRPKASRPPHWPFRLHLRLPTSPGRRSPSAPMAKDPWRSSAFSDWRAAGEFAGLELRS
jgi:hypothetical protein